MTLNRALLTLGLLILTTFAVLAFGNPQWHWRLYMAQAVLGIKPAFPVSNGNHWYMAPPENYDGIWRMWDADGHIGVILICRYGNQIVAFDGPNDIDRRVEFGIEVE